MNTGRTSLIAFLLFFVGLFVAIPLIQVSPIAAIVAGVVSVLGFTYAMYLWLWGMRYGDKRLVKRGISGTAEVIESKETSWSMASGEYYGIGAPSVWRYKLEVTLGTHHPYRTTLYICAHLQEGSTIPVKVSRWNHKRVTLDGPAFAEVAPGSARQRERALRDSIDARIER